MDDPAVIGLMLALIYVVASFVQVALGHLIDHVPLKPLQTWLSVGR